MTEYKIVKEKKHPTRLSSQQSSQLNQEIRSLILQGTLSKQIERDLCEKWNFSKIQMQRRIFEQFSHLDSDLVDKMKYDFNKTFENLNYKMQVLIDSAENSDDLRKSIDLMMKLIKERTDFLERFHMKKKAQENITITEERQLVIDFDQVKDVEVIETGTSKD